MRSASNGLNVPVESLDFGVVVEQPKLVHPIPLRNTSRYPVFVRDVLTSCSCSEIRPRSFTLDPNAEVILLATVDVSSVHRNAPAALAVGSHTRQMEVDILVHTAGPKGTSAEVRSWQLKGRVKPHPVRIASGQLYFAQRVTALGESQSRQVLISTEESVAEVSIAATLPSEVTASIHRQIAPVGGYLLEVSPVQSLPVGDYSVDIELHATDRAGRRLPAVQVPIHISITPDVFLLPSRVSFLPTHLGEVLDEEVSIRSHTGAFLSISGIEVSHPDLEVVSPHSATFCPDDENLILRYHAKEPIQRGRVVVDIEFARATEQPQHQRLFLEVVALPPRQPTHAARSTAQ